MKRAVLPLVFGAGLCLSALSANADIDYYEVANLTFSGGVLNYPYGPTDYPVADNLTFNNLQLMETFGGGTVTDTVIDGTASLDAIAYTLDSAQFDTTANGGLVSATITGDLSSTTVDVYNQVLPNTGTTTVTMNPTFTATLTGGTAGSYINIDATDTSSNPYAIGTLSLLNVGPSTPAVPEPNAVAFMAAFGCGLVSMLALNRRARRA